MCLYSVYNTHFMYTFDTHSNLFCSQISTSPNSEKNGANWNIPKLCHSSFDMFEAQKMCMRSAWPYALWLTACAEDPVCRAAILTNDASNHAVKLQKTGSSLTSTGGLPPTGGPSAVTSTLRSGTKSCPPQQPLGVKIHPKNLKSLRGYVELNFKCPLLTHKNNSNCQPAGRLYFATSKRSTADGPPRRTIMVKTPSIHPYLTNTLKVASQFWCVFLMWYL